MRDLMKLSKICPATSTSCSSSQCIFFESFIKSHIESHTSTIYVDFKEMSLPTLLQIYLLPITPPRTARIGALKS